MKEIEYFFEIKIYSDISDNQLYMSYNTSQVNKIFVCFSRYFRNRGLWLVILLYLGNRPAFAQPSYEIRFDSRTKDEVCGPIVCTPEGEIFFILWSAESPNWTFTKGYSTLYKINPEGDTIRWSYQKVDTLLFYRALLLDHTANLLLAGDGYCLDTVGNKSGTFQWFCKLTREFEIIWQRTYHFQTTGNYNQNQSILTELLNNCYLYGNSILPDTSYTNYTYLFKINNQGDSILYFHNNDELKHPTLTSFTLSEDSLLIGLHLFGGVIPPDQSDCWFLQYDTSFNLIRNQHYTNPDYGSAFYTMNGPGGGYISCGRYWPFTKGLYPERYIRIQKMNEDLSLQDFIDLTDSDPDMPTYAAWYQDFDFIDPKKIFVGGMDYVGYGIWNPDPGLMYVACVDENLDLIHEEYYGGDASYKVYYVKATPDGGVILTGSVYNDSIQDYERDGFLMKFDSSLFVGMDELNPELSSAKAGVFPNPGKDYVSIKTSLPVIRFDLFNSLGDNILTINQSGKEFSIPTFNLTAGIYFWMIIFTDSRMETGKWIKR